MWCFHFHFVFNCFLISTVISSLIHGKQLGREDYMHHWLPRAGRPQGDEMNKVRWGLWYEQTDTFVPPGHMAHPGLADPRG